MFIQFLEENLMISTIKKWGNSQGIILTKELLETAGISVEDRVRIYADNLNRIIIEKENKKPTFEELFENWDGEYVMSEEIDWGNEPVGREVW